MSILQDFLITSTGVVCAWGLCGRIRATASEVPALSSQPHPVSASARCPIACQHGRAATAKEPKAHRHSRPEVVGGPAIQVISPSEGLAVSNMRARPNAPH